ncbi:siroheme decarboxylase subunit alpha [Persephonella sp.]
MIETLSDVQVEVLKHLQEGIPLVKEPFKHLAEKIGIEEEHFISIIKQLKDQKIIRQISPIYDTKSLGYDSSLVAFRVKGDVDSAAGIINTHPGVSHNYLRTDSFNLWFTIAVPPDSSLGLEKTVEFLAGKTGVEDYVILKTVKLYKIGVKLDFGKMDEKEENNNGKKNTKLDLTPEDKQIIKVTQEDMPLMSRPFQYFSDILGIDEDELINRLSVFHETGVMRRFAAILYHRKAGFKANGMTVWKVPEEKVDEVGYTLASYRAVTHCYKRTTNEKWQYNLFSMIHAKTREELEEFVGRLSEETGIKEYRILYSTKEYKKKRIKYFSDEFYKWEEDAKNGGDINSGLKN